MDSQTQNETGANAGGNDAKSVLGTLSEVARDLKTVPGVPYGRAKFTYVNGAGETKTMTMLAFGKAWQNLKDVWNEGYHGYVYCRYAPSEDGVTMRGINKGRAPAPARSAQPALAA